MAFVKIEKGIVVQKQPTQAEGFIETSDSVCCGMVYNEETGDFSAPELSPQQIVEKQIQEKQAVLSGTDKDMARVAEDIIGLLVEKQLIDPAEIPAKVKDKMTARATLRAELAALDAE